jgi:hypothetical protein
VRLSDSGGWVRQDTVDWIYPAQEDRFRRATIALKYAFALAQKGLSSENQGASYIEIFFNSSF